MPEALAQKKFSCPACGAAAEWNPAKQSLICPFCGTISTAQRPPRFLNPKGISAISQGLRSYPGLSFNKHHQPQRGCGRLASFPPNMPQPRWGCSISSSVPRVARAVQPWALRQNPVGILIPMGLNCGGFNSFAMNSGLVSFHA